ncbi:hypothetical protein SNE40_012183 [Patella caerulea]|uniref:Fibrinogen C-terminal domain-containing protein n=1 Tax=Patella caerulea TaxID=87958 RepID=A0AAN8PVG6_PATCE
MKELKFSYDNFTSYTSLQISQAENGVLQEMRKYQNWSANLEKEVLEMKVDTMKGKLEHNSLLTQVTNMRRQVDALGADLDELEMNYYNIRTRIKEAIPPKYDGENYMGKDLAQLLKNTVGNLKAEWLLMKRELQQIRTDNTQLKNIQNVVKNDTTSLRQMIRSVTGEVQAMEGQVKSSEISRLETRLTSIKNDFLRIKDSQNDLKHETSQFRNELTTVQGSIIRLQKDVHELQIDNTQMKEKMAVRVTARERTGREERQRGESLGHILPRRHEKARDCHELYMAGFTVSGVYSIKPDGTLFMDTVYCEMVNKTGYTVLQRRVDGLLNFNRRWLEYRYGFGNPYAEFWIGNDKMHALTTQKQYILRIDIWDWEGNKAYAEYNSFSVEDAEQQFRLHIGGYYGDAGDSFSYHDNMVFSTEDVDNDLHTRNCAAENKGGWWFNSCYSCHLNGIYHTAWYPQAQSKYADGISWYTWKDSEFYSLKKVEMKIRPKTP